MGILSDNLKKSMSGKDIVDFYQKNTILMYNKYSKSDNDCKSVNKIDITTGCFYFLHYKDDSNWMRYSPIFCCDYRKINNMIIVLGVNFNFIPIELRVSIFDKFIKKDNIENNDVLEVDFKGMYTELLKYGFEYSIQEYNVSQIVQIHRISLNILPTFLYSSHPLNKYDPKKLMEIWESKLVSKEKRHQEITKSLLNEFYEINKDINSKYDILKDHITRVQKSYEKYGKNN